MTSRSQPLASIETMYQINILAWRLVTTAMVKFVWPARHFSRQYSNLVLRPTRWSMVPMSPSIPSFVIFASKCSGRNQIVWSGRYPRRSETLEGGRFRRAVGTSQGRVYSPHSSKLSQIRFGARNAGFRLMTTSLKTVDPKFLVQPTSPQPVAHVEGRHRGQRPR